nr:DUF3870 domain-containing protein [uncultured Cloacibacillus sp.]
MERETLCIIGNAKSPKSDPITHRFVHFFITFIADAETGEILDLEVSTALQLTNIFIRGLFIGRPLRRWTKLCWRKSVLIIWELRRGRYK